MPGSALSTKPTAEESQRSCPTFADRQPPNKGLQLTTTSLLRSGSATILGYCGCASAMTVSAVCRG